jgi:hypothetical protein
MCIIPSDIDPVAIIVSEIDGMSNELDLSTLS